MHALNVYVIYLFVCHVSCGCVRDFLRVQRRIVTLELDAESNQVFLNCYPTDVSCGTVPLGANSARFTVCDSACEITTVTPQQLSVWRVTGSGVEHLLDVVRAVFDWQTA